MNGLNWRLLICFGVFAWAVIGAMPNFTNMEKRWWPTKAKMVLGLDIQGGSHLVLQADVDSAVKRETARFAAGLKAELEKEHANIKGVQTTDPLTGAMTLDLASPADQKPTVDFLEKFYANTFRIDDQNDHAVQITFAELYLREFKKNLVEQSIATIRNRIDEFGVAEPSISAQGSNRILVQLPGIADASSAKELINKTARLDFMMLSYELPPDKLNEMIKEAEEKGGFKFADMKYTQYVDKLNEALKDKLPKDTILLFEKAESAADMLTGRMPMLLKTGHDDVVPGDQLTDAHVGLGEFGRPEVNFTFNATGARQFAELTKKNTGKQMAIVLDKIVKSAPNIQTPITEGRGRITLGSSRDPQAQQNEAKLISLALRAGALPASLEQLEERTVGPSLGADAIHKGAIAAIVAGIAVFVFMFVWYRSFGLIADLSLVLNALVTMAVLSALGATLTLPGVAGLALAVGIAVDANVIIYERVKEEMGKGATLIAGIKEGYERAFSSIIDANLTSIAVCVVLMYFGSGPVRGFAVTLLCSLVTTVFTAVFFTRAVLDLVVGKWKWNLAVKWT